jgi:hypothetical protein
MSLAYAGFKPLHEEFLKKDSFALTWSGLTPINLPEDL